MHRITAGFFDGGSVEITVTGLSSFTANLNSISFGHSLETSKIYSLGSQVAKGYTQGQISADDGSMELHTQDLLNWVESSGGPFGFHNSEFDITINYRLVGMPMNTIVLQRCRARKVTSENPMGPEVLVSTVEYSCLDVTYNGVGGLFGLAVQSLLPALGSIGSLL